MLERYRAREWLLALPSPGSTVLEPRGASVTRQVVAAAFVTLHTGVAHRQPRIATKAMGSQGRRPATEFGGVRRDSLEKKCLR
jgi:hypothetical protein